MCAVRIRDDVAVARRQELGARAVRLGTYARIRIEDEPRVIKEQHGVGCLLEKRTEPALARLQLTLFEQGRQGIPQTASDLLEESAFLI